MCDTPCFRIFYVSLLLDKRKEICEAQTSSGYVGMNANEEEKIHSSRKWNFPFAAS